MEKIFNKEINILNHKINIRIVPNKFKYDVEYIGRLIDERDYKMANFELQKAINRWGYDKELEQLKIELALINEDNETYIH